MVDTFLMRDTFLPLAAWLALFHMSALGGLSTSMLLSLLISESSSDSSSSSLCSLVVCTRLILLTTRLALLLNLTLLPLSAGLIFWGGVELAPNPCVSMKWVFLSSAVAKLFPQFFSKHLVDVQYFVPWLVLLQFLHGSRVVDFGDPPPLGFGEPW
jgi:hypothetical protein